MDRPADLSPEQLARWAAEWAPRLFLAPWDIEYAIARRRDLGSVLGQCRYAETKHVAEIRLLDPIDWDPADDWRYDPEKTLVHELLHLSFSEFFIADQDSPAHKAMERAIDLLARAFVGLKRELSDNAKDYP